MADVVVKRSKIAKKGVFASRDFKKGEVVMKWDTSHKLTEEEVKNVPEEQQHYVAYNSGKYILMQPPARYINHSCEANTVVKDHADVALRDIKKGEEITSNYAEDLAPGVEMVCACGSKKCRKLILAM
ncbi:MAG: SET domain-containing protein [Candidatus Woesearchaeota archaeon]|jgi:hypothetical protein|nr:SET domain-containing protein [Candidatus Woesearchaeota archaeon]MDP7181276.1 SET domain-containing protein [Candidatus Woesearchaeota archaeon]MDP7198105.1 SET domain-containing protein [Candidatus Woesearchaeota archaeon]MDP7466939.1 SET domain-containing protein [Candidatus Woesearchaeota archaeon]MDP7647375.1 SET domain-containing protein [Candidatus Woesearchaeota archaeon]|tara:strand:- start:8 stop:391 length:384 start_codon:yes stop_codon:yes gene_type:complete